MQTIARCILSCQLWQCDTEHKKVEFTNFLSQPGPIQYIQIAPWSFQRQILDGCGAE